MKQTGKPQPTIDPTKCIRDLRGVTPQTYAMAEDGRKGKWLRVRRAELVLRLATYADADGSNIRVGSNELSVQMDLSRRTVTYLLDDLSTGLGFLENQGIDGFYKTRIRRLNVAAILRAAAAAPSPDDNPHAQDNGDHMRKIADPHAQNSGVHAQSSALHAQDSKPNAQDSTSHAQNTYCAQPTSSPASLPATPPPSVPSGQKAEVVGLAGDGLAASKSLTPEDILWQQMREHEDFPEEMLTAVPRKAQDEKRRVVEQLKAYGVEAVVQALATWADERDMGLTGLGTKWRAWLEEGEPLLAKEKAEQDTLAKLTKKKAADQIIIEQNVQRQKDEHTRRFTTDASPENGASVENYIEDFVNSDED